jgi:hypothetical protein
MKYLLLITMLLFKTQLEFEPAPAPIVRQKMGEVEYVAEYAKILFDKCEVEYALPDGRRVDVLTETHAYEADWSYKYTEGLGQSLSYAVATNRSPGLILLMKGADDERYNQCLGVITHLRSRGYNFEFIAINVENGKIWRH